MCATDAALNNDYTFKSVTTRYKHTCGLIDGNTAGHADGEALCWGRNTVGQSAPPVASNSTNFNFSQVAVRRLHTCGLLDDQNGQPSGKAVCWGDDGRGQASVWLPSGLGCSRNA